MKGNKNVRPCTPLHSDVRYDRSKLLSNTPFFLCLFWRCVTGESGPLFVSAVYESLRSNSTNIMKSLTLTQTSRKWRTNPRDAFRDTRPLCGGNVVPGWNSSGGRGVVVFVCVGRSCLNNNEWCFPNISKYLHPGLGRSGVIASIGLVCLASIINILYETYQAGEEGWVSLGS